MARCLNAFQQLKAVLKTLLSRKGLQLAQATTKQQLTVACITCEVTQLRLEQNNQELCYRIALSCSEFLGLLKQIVREFRIISQAQLSLPNQLHRATLQPASALHMDTGDAAFVSRFTLEIQIRIKSFHALRTQAVTEFSSAMLADVDFDATPVALVFTDFQTSGANPDQFAHLASTAQRICQLTLTSFQQVVG